ncbi:Intracellular distribution of mitochondria, partial [Ascosphaera acerosa]
MGKRLVAQSIVPGIFKQREPGEHQIDYGGVEGKEVVAEHKDFVPVFEKLSAALRVKNHPVWDKEGKRHDLEGSVETKGLLGTDGRKYVLDLYRITPLDIAWLEDADAGHEPYPHKMAVLRLELIDAYWRHKMAEYVKAEVEKKRAAIADKKPAPAPAPAVEDDKAAAAPAAAAATAAAEEKKEEGEEADKKEADKESTEKTDDDERVDISNFKLALNPDVFSGQVPQTDEEKAAWAEDEKEVRAAGEFLVSKVLPELIHDLHEGDVGFPMDGQSLTQLLHKRGINIRYLGKLVSLAEDKGARLAALKALLVQEMLARAFKHVACKYLRHVPTPFTAVAIVHLLNCLLGADVNAEPKAEIDAELRALYPEGDFTFETVTPASLAAEMEKNVAVRYRYRLPSGWPAEIKHLQMLRSVALKLGLQVGEREFVFEKAKLPAAETAATTAVNGSAKSSDDERNSSSPAPPAGSSSKKSKKRHRRKEAQNHDAHATASSIPKQTLTFHAEDLVNIVPLVKDAAPRSALAEEALEAGRISLMQGQKELGQELILESLSLHEQIYGILHPE